MTGVCAGSELPRGTAGKFYMLRTYGDSKQEVWDVTAPETPVRITEFGRFRSTHKN